MTTITAAEGTAGDAGAPAARPAHGVARRFARKPLATTALLVVLLMVLAVCLAGVLSPYSPLKQDLDAVLAGPSAAHPLGTDDLGRDLLSRILYGGRPALLGVGLAAAMFLVVGLLLGLLAGYFGGWTDRVVGVVTDGLMSLPSIILVLAVLAIFDQNITLAMLVFGVLAAGSLVRIVRGATLSLREEPFVAAARVCGLSDLRIMARHVLPGLVGPIVVQLSLFCGAALSVQTGLGFLGQGTIPPAPSWGSMVGEAATVMNTSGYMLLVTGGVIALMIVALGLFGDGVRDVTSERRRSASVRPGGRRRPRRAPAAETVPSDPALLLEFDDFSVGFEEGREVTPVVRSVSFGIGPGEVVGLVGESGSGKTVTALSVLGLLPGNGRVTGGDVRLRGRSIADLDERGYRPIRGHEIGLVSQEPMVALDPMFTVGSQLGEVLKNLRSLPRKQIREESVRLLQRVRLADAETVLGLYPHQLSGGMAQRVVIAIALAGNPSLLIADEPTTALDVTVQAEILDLLKDLTRSGMGILLVTHDLGVVADICDRAVVMSCGSIVERASLEEVFYRPTSEYTKRLIASTPSLVVTR